MCSQTRLLHHLVSWRYLGFFFFLSKLMIVVADVEVGFKTGAVGGGGDGAVLPRTSSLMDA